MQYKVLPSILCGSIEKTLNDWDQKGYELVQILAFEDDITVTLIMRRINVPN